MPLFALISCTESEENGETYIVNAAFKVKEMKNANLMEQYIKEIAKSKNIEVPIADSSFFRKDEYTVYTVRMNTPDVTFMAFTNELYSDTQAYNCLEEYKDIFFKKVQPAELYAVEKDRNTKIAGVAELLRSYYKGDQGYRVRGLGANLQNVTDQAHENLEKTKNAKDRTDQMMYYTKRINQESEYLNTKMGTGKYGKKQCCTCNIF